MSVRIQEVISALERFAPLPLQESYDNAGLQMGLTEAEVSGALLCLDVTEEVILEAIDLGCNLIVSHHPVLFHGLKTISDATQVQRCVRLAIQNDLCIYSAHTNLDNAMDGVNYHIAERLGLIDVEMMLPRRVAVRIDGQRSDRLSARRRGFLCFPATREASLRGGMPDAQRFASAPHPKRSPLWRCR